jgi:hypothetical protein
MEKRLCRPGRPRESRHKCVNAGESLKRDEQHVGGQLWIQSDRQMTATTIPFPGMSNDAESACLAGVAEAVEWTSPLEDKRQRSTQRVVIYPPTLYECKRVLSGDMSDIVNGHEIAYQRISDACSCYVSAPVFYSADSSEFGGLKPEKVSLWMHTAAQVSIGGRRQVLEDGPDVCNSESDSDNEDHGDKLTGMYTSAVPLDSNGHPMTSACKVTPEQAAAARAKTVLQAPPPRLRFPKFPRSLGRELGKVRRFPRSLTRKFPRRWPPGHNRRVRAELEACDRWAVQGQWIRVLQMATLPKPEP